MLADASPPCRCTAARAMSATLPSHGEYNIGATRPLRISTYFATDHRDSCVSDGNVLLTTANRPAAAPPAPASPPASDHPAAPPARRRTPPPRRPCRASPARRHGG